MPAPTFIATDIVRFIEATGESENIDAKAAMSWDNGPAAAGLAKDIAAFANSRDGGVIVLGKSEVAPGKFTLDGLTEPQAASFDTTDVATWLNNRFAPPIRLQCHRQEYLGNVFVVITIGEFDDVPHLCIKSYQDPNKAKNHLIREGTIYVRSANAASVPLGSIEQLRSLIGLATRERGHEMVTVFDAMLKGRPLLAPPDVQQLYEKEYQTITAGLSPDLQKKIDAGAWMLRIHPMTYVPERWKTQEAAEALIQRRSIRIRDEFPPTYRGVHMREWGICNDLYGDIWTLARSGQFVYTRAFRENDQPYECPWMTAGRRPAEDNIPAGQWIEFRSNLFLICEMFMFASRFAEEFEPGEVLSLELRATNLGGRQLRTVDFNIGLYPTDPCRAQVFQHPLRVPVEELRANWEAMCAETMRRFIELFPGSRVTTETALFWIQKFKKRDF